MSDLVIINSKKEAVCSHVVISEGMEVTQDAALKLIKKYKSDLEEFGKVRFKNSKKKTDLKSVNLGGRPTREYMLNRDQAIFLITLMRNNPKTVAFKKALVKQFTKMESWIKDRIQASRESLTLDEVNLLNELQTRNAVLIGAGMSRDNRKEALRIMVELKQVA